MSYEAERARLISDFESEATSIRKHYNVAHKSKASELDDKDQKKSSSPKGRASS